MYRDQNCGRGLAPDEGVPVSLFLADPPPSGASPLPHLDCASLEGLHHWHPQPWATPPPEGLYRDQNCGRGLAPDEGVPVSLFLADPPPSGASPLPHFDGASLEGLHDWHPQPWETPPPEGLYRDQNCGRGLAPDGGMSVSSSIADPPPSGASPLPQLVITELECSAAFRASRFVHPWHPRAWATTRP